MKQCIECSQFDVCQLSGAFADDEACEDFDPIEYNKTDPEEPGKSNNKDYERKERKCNVGSK